MLEEVKQKIEELSPWYQRVNLDGTYTTDKKLTGEHIWPYIRSFLPSDLKGKRFMDIGANACYYSIMMALEKAEVIAIEPNKKYYAQALFLKEFYEKKYNRKLNLQIIKTGISNLDLNNFGKFDTILALSVIYFIGRKKGKAGKYCDEALIEQKRVVSEVTNMTDKIIVRTRDKVYYSSVKYYTEIFSQNNFGLIEVKRKGLINRPLILYGKGKSNGH